MDIYKGFPRGILRRGLEQHHAPYAAWMEPEVIKKYAIDPEKTGKDPILGKVDGEYIAIPDDRMTAIISGSRGHKGRGFLVPFMLSYPGSIVCPSDCKGELVSIAGRYRAEVLGQRLIIPDPFNIVTDPALQQYKSHFNIMAHIHEDNPFAVEDAGLISDALCIASGAGNDVHWVESGITGLDGIILHVASSPDFRDSERDLVTVRKLITHGTECGGETGMMGLYAHMLMNDAFDGVVQAAASDLFERPPQERGGVLSTMRRSTKFIDFRSMKSVLRGENTFTFDELKENKKGVTIMLCLPTNRLVSCNRWLRAFLQVCLGKLEECPHRPRYPVVMLLEEFANAIGFLKNIEVAGTLMAGHDVRLLYVLQGLGQLQALYKDGWEAMLGSCGTQLYFSNADLTTTEYLSRRLGKTSMNVMRDSESTPEQWQKGTGAGRSSGTEQCDLMTPEEIARFFAREQNRVLVLQSGRDPIALERMAYDTDPFFEGKYDVWR